MANGDEGDYAGLLKIDGYTLTKGDRSYGKGGEVATYVKSSIKFKRRQDLENPY